MIGDPTLYKVKNFGSSKMFVTRVFCAYVITLSTAISLDWCKIETTWNHFYLQSRLCPIDWCHCREGHVTILLAVWRFWPLAVIQTVGNGALVMSTVVGQVPGHGSKGARTGVTALPTSIPIMYFYHLLAANGFAELWLRGGVGDKTRFIPLHVIAVKVGKPVCEVLPATHVAVTTQPAVTLPANLAWKLLASRLSLFCTWRTLGGHIRMCRTVCRTLRSTWYHCSTEGSMALKRWIVNVLTGTII